MDHPHIPTPIQKDKYTALGIVTNNMQPKRTKEIYIRLHWLSDRDTQRQFILYWRPGTRNQVGY